MPTFFIVGAPKCGTTALATYLNERSDVFMCQPKEPHYFATDLQRYRAVVSEESYLQLFAEASNMQLCGEASVFYLYSENALKLLQEFKPSAKLIVMLRNPVELVHSFHSQLLFSGDEDIEDFKEAWLSSQLRKRGERIPKYCRAQELLYYDDVAKLGGQMKRLFDIFPRDQVHIIFYDDFATDTRNEYLKVLKYLGLSEDNRLHFPRINRNRRYRSKILMDLLCRRIGVLTGPVANLKSLLGIERFGILEKIQEFAKVYERRKPLDGDMRAIVQETFSEDLALLKVITGRSLKELM